MALASSLKCSLSASIIAEVELTSSRTSSHAVRNMELVAGSWRIMNFCLQQELLSREVRTGNLSSSFRSKLVFEVLGNHCYFSSKENHLDSHWRFQSNLERKCKPARRLRLNRSIGKLRRCP
jgi:hypothetical protein